MSHTSGEWVVDPVACKVACKGTARFRWTEGPGAGQAWDEQFAYILDFDDECKVTEYQVWADSGAAYLARLGQLDGLNQVRVAGCCVCRRPRLIAYRVHRREGRHDEKAGLRALSFKSRARVLSCALLRIAKPDVTLWDSFQLAVRPVFLSGSAKTPNTVTCLGLGQVSDTPTPDLVWLLHTQITR